MPLPSNKNTKYSNESVIHLFQNDKMNVLSLFAVLIVVLSFTSEDVAGFSSNSLNIHTPTFFNPASISSNSFAHLSLRESKSDDSEPAEITNDTTEDGSSSVDLYTVVDEMLDASLLMYPIADIRRFARQGKLTKSFLQTPVSARELSRLIEENGDEIQKLFGGEGVSMLSIDALGAMVKRQNKRTEARLVEFQDMESNEELVYAVGIDHSRRRVTVAFRGSSTKQDFLVDFEVWFKRQPNRMRKYDSSQPKRTRIHAGFYNYLFGKETVTDEEFERLQRVNPEKIELVEDEEISKFDEILQFHVIPLLRKNPGYKLYVTGHSLGGALCTLFGFRASTIDSGEIPKPVNIFSFASPFVGNGQYRKAFQLAEKMGFVRHLRVTNHRDAVPVANFMALPLPRTYKHVGLHLRLYERECTTKDYEFLYPSRRLWYQRLWKNSFLSNLAYPKKYLQNHGCYEHSSRLDQYKEKFTNITVEEVYQKWINQ